MYALSEDQFESKLASTDWRTWPEASGLRRPLLLARGAVSRRQVKSLMDRAADQRAIHSARAALRDKKPGAWPGSLRHCVWRSACLASRQTETEQVPVARSNRFRANWW